MAEQEPDRTLPDLVPAAAEEPYATRVRSLLGMPRQGLVAEARRFPDSFEQLSFAPFSFLGHADPDPAESDELEFSVAEARALPAPAAASGGADDATGARRAGGSSVAARAPTDLDDAGPPASSRGVVDLPSGTAGTPARGAAGVSGAGPVLPQCGEPEPRTAPDFIAEPASAARTPEQSVRAVETEAAIPVAHVHVAIPGRGEVPNLPRMDAAPPRVAAAGADAEPVREAADRDALVEPAPAAQHRAISDRYEPAILGAGSARVRPVSSRAPRAAMPRPDGTAGAGRVAPEAPRAAAPSSESREETAAAVAIPRGPKAQNPQGPMASASRAGHEARGGHEAHGSAAPRRGRDGGTPAATPILRTQPGETFVPVREDRKRAQLAEKVERLEAAVERQHAALRQAARPEPREAPRFVFLADRPAPAERAYWARRYLARVASWPRR